MSLNYQLNYQLSVISSYNKSIAIHEVFGMGIPHTIEVYWL